MRRREFLQNVVAGTTTLSIWPTELMAKEATRESVTEAAALRQRIIDTLADSKATIEGVDFYGIHIDAERRFSYEVQDHRQHAFIRVRAGEHDGWTEANLGFNKQHPKIPIEKRVWRMHWFANLRGKTVAEALQYLAENRDKHEYRQLEYAETALLDLAGRLLNRPTIELLELTGRDAVPGVYCILSDQADVVAREAKRAISQDLGTHLKVKLYGDLETDLAVVRAARSVIGPDAYLIGDVNFGYRREPNDQPIDAIADSMIKLSEVGLSGCEDPAAMTTAQWSNTQRLVGELDLVPDVPLRPAWKAIEQIESGMGRVFNMHPACMGSLIELVSLSRKIKSWDKRLMVGDSSLVGPACSVWQQLAIGMNADWVEAIEKPQESDVFQQCLLKQSMGRSEKGEFTLQEALPGFGSQLDTKKLSALAFDVFSV